MRQHTNILIVGLIFGLFACNSSTGKQEAGLNKNPAVDSVQLTDRPSEIASVKDLRDECVRGQAEPVIKKSVFPKTTFTLQPDSLTAIETVDFDNGDKLTLRNWGCEYYVLTFRFETSRFKADVTDLKYWYVAVYKIITGMKQGIDAPVNIGRGLQALNEYISKSAPDLTLHKEIDFGGDEIRDFVTVERIEKLTDKKYALTVSFTTGPL